MFKWTLKNMANVRYNADEALALILANSSGELTNSDEPVLMVDNEVNLVSLVRFTLVQSVLQKKS